MPIRSPAHMAVVWLRSGLVADRILWSVGLGLVICWEHSLAYLLIQWAGNHLPYSLLMLVVFGEVVLR